MTGCWAWGWGGAGWGWWAVRSLESGLHLLVVARPCFAPPGASHNVHPHMLHACLSTGAPLSCAFPAQEKERLAKQAAAEEGEEGEEEGGAPKKAGKKSKGPQVGRMLQWQCSFALGPW